MKDKTVELKDVIGMRGHDVLATDLDWIIGILSHGSLTTTVPQGTCIILWKTYAMLIMIYVR